MSSWVRSSFRPFREFVRSFVRSSVGWPKALGERASSCARTHFPATNASRFHYKPSRTRSVLTHQLRAAQQHLAAKISASTGTFCVLGCIMFFLLLSINDLPENLCYFHSVPYLCVCPLEKKESKSCCRCSNLQCFCCKRPRKIIRIRIRILYVSVCVCLLLCFPVLDAEGSLWAGIVCAEALRVFWCKTVVVVVVAAAAHVLYVWNGFSSVYLSSMTNFANS
jgi:hypothetical protein